MLTLVLVLVLVTALFAPFVLILLLAIRVLDAFSRWLLSAHRAVGKGGGGGGGVGGVAALVLEGSQECHRHQVLRAAVSGRCRSSRCGGHNKGRGQGPCRIMLLLVFLVLFVLLVNVCPGWPSSSSLALWHVRGGVLLATALAGKDKVVGWNVAVTVQSLRALDLETRAKSEETWEGRGAGGKVRG